MTPQEQWKEQPPQRRKADFVEIVKWSALGVLIGGLAAVAYFMLGAPLNDDDRPPIIVRNGSAHIEVAHPGSDGDKGKLVRVNQTKVWHHKHGGGGPQKFTVIVSGVDPGLGNNCTATPHFYARRVSTLTVTYSRTNLTDRTIGIAVANGDLQITADPEAEVAQAYDYLVDLDKTDFAALKSVTMVFKKKPNDPDTTITCTFGGTVAREVVVVQRQ